MSLRGSGSQANSLAGCFGGTCQVGASRVYSTSLRAYPEAQLYLLFNIKISIFEDFGGEVLKRWACRISLRGFSLRMKRLDLQGRAGLLFAAHFYCAAAAAAQYEKGVSCNP
ncbi:hypothetical protein BY996DRAFT_6425698 [Phakopsora pachyrhizi]|nr:hypothetical protein BY996DRAFT_6425698 [Phakopsora pachyrhizi]